MRRNIFLLAAVVSILAGGTVIYQFLNTEPNPGAVPPEPAPPPKPKSVMEVLEGEYALVSWTQANRQMDLGMEATSGALSVGSDGTLDWRIDLSQKHSSNPGKVHITARGKFVKSSMQVVGVPGGSYNNTTHYDTRWSQVDSDQALAMRGWSTGQTEDPFQISIDERSNGQVQVDMQNSRGIFSWVKK